MTQSKSSRGIFYEWRSTGEEKATLVLVMGYSGSSAAWSEAFLQRLQEHYNLIILDNRGTGRSLKPKEVEAYSMGELAADLGSVIEATGVKDFHLLGYSLGGCIALEYALQNPVGIKSLLLVASTLGGSAYVPPPLDTIERLGYPQGKDLLELNRWIWEICMSPKKVEELLPLLITTMVTEREHMTPRFALSGQLAAYKKFNRAQQLRFPFPVHVISGDSDPLTSLKNSQNMLALIKNAKLHVLKNCQHMPHLECPTEYADLICQCCS